MRSPPAYQRIRRSLGTPDPRDYPRRLRSLLSRLRRRGLADGVRHALGRARQAYQLRSYSYNPRRLYVRLESVAIDRPVFLLGVPGGGGTILARILYRHPRAVYASGNSSWWAGQDEIQKCRHIRDLPEPLVLRSAHFWNVTDAVQEHPVYGFQRSPLYAIDELLPHYRRGAGDADPETAAAFRRVLRKIVLAYAHDPRAARFVDMSHLYTIQVPYLAALLSGADPRFVLVTRDPYVVCERAVEKDFSGMGARRELSRAEKIRCAVEAWDNSYRLALEAAGEVGMLVVRYEDFVADPEASVRRVCEFAELDFHPDQMPHPSHRLPIGSNSETKWFPIRRDENEVYLARVEPDLVEAVNRRSSDLLERLGYARRGATPARTR